MKNYFIKTTLILLVFSLTSSCSSDSDNPNPAPTPCPQGYTGSNCSTQITPSKIKILNIRVTKFPNSKVDGSSWDTFPVSAPDIYVKLLKGTTNNLYTSGFYSDVVSNGSNYFDFTPTVPIEITDLNSPYVLNLFDYDNLPNDDNMGFYAFYLYSATGGFPTNVSVGSTTDALRIEMTLSYVW